MVDNSSLIMIVFGALLGLLSILPGRQVYQGRPFYLKQDWRFRVDSLWAILVALLLAVLFLTEVAFRWVHFLVGLLIVGVPATVISRIAWRGQLSGRWTNALRSLYEPEPTRYSRSNPPMLPSSILDLFDPQATQFSLSNALFFAHLSWLAYQPKDVVKQTAAEWNCPIIFIENDNHVALVVSLLPATVLTFRGTDDIKDWQANVNILPRKTPWGNVHSGFLSSLEMLWPEIRETLSQLREREQTPWFAGHSLGAAMAVLGSMKLTVEEGHAVGGIYTFGQPLLAARSFGKVYNQKLQNKLFRFEMPRDEVTNQPAGYYPVGTLQYLDRYGNLHTNPNSLWKLADQIRKHSQGLGEEHSILEYLRIVEGLHVAS